MFKSIKMARDFEKTLKSLKAITPKVKRYKVKITERQIGILEYCAIIDIKDFHQLVKFIHPKKGK